MYRYGWRGLFLNPSAAGMVPDPPYPECDGFDPDSCDGCPEYDTCESEWEEGEPND